MNTTPPPMAAFDSSLGVVLPRESLIPLLPQRDEQAIKSAKIMIIDDEPLVARVVRRFLSSAGYSHFSEISDSRLALDEIGRQRPDVVLLDILMPHVSGLDILRARQTLPCCFTPFIILSATSDRETKREALELGATEFLNKPLDPSDLTLRVRNALLVKAHQDHLANYAVELERKVLERTMELERSHEQIIYSLAKAAEYRDNDTGKHVLRVGKYAALIAHELGFSEEYRRRLEMAAQLHDVGKIAVPDAILLSPGKLSEEEFEIMKQHCELGLKIIEPIGEDEAHRIRCHATIGGDLLRGDFSPMMTMARHIALTHHEKWDGTGYPNGLAGEDIPIEGRIVCVADVFDALSSRRPYKEPLQVARSLEIMRQERGARFDPQVLDAFLRRIDDVGRISREYEDA